MSLRNFFVGRALGLLILLSILGIVAGFYALNNYIYREKQADTQNLSIYSKTWVWTEALYNDGIVVRPKEGSNFTLTFGTDGKFVAGTDCNSVGGTYSEGYFTDIYSTKMYCEGSQESEFVSLLQNVSGHDIVGGQLILNLKYDSGSVVFR